MTGVRTVTALIPTFNRAEYLGECIEAILGQVVPPEQVLVIDDGSTDATSEVVARFGGRVELHAQRNSGKAAALNAGLALARGDGIWIFDDDDVAEPDALAKLKAALDARPSAGFAFGRHDNFQVGEDGSKTFTTPWVPAVDEDDLHYALLAHCFIFQPAMLVRKACYDAVGPFDTSLVRAQDYEMLLRLAGRYRAAHVDAVLFHQRQHQGARGPAGHRIPGDEVWARQGAFDSLVIDKAVARAGLDTYLSWSCRDAEPEPGLGPESTLRALLRKAALLAHRNKWSLAAATLREADERALALPGIDHARLVPPLFAEVGGHLRDLARWEQASGFLEAARAMRHAGLRRRILTMVLRPVTRAVIRSGLRGRPWYGLRYLRALGGRQLLAPMLGALPALLRSNRAA